jgi:hypothetical protein
MNTNPLWEGLARDSRVSVTIDVDCADAIASKRPLTGFDVRRQVGAVFAFSGFTKRQVATEVSAVKAIRLKCISFKRFFRLNLWRAQEIT